MNKENIVYTYNGILFNLKKRELQNATTWVNLEEIMLSEISQSRRNSAWFHLYELSKIDLLEAQSRMVVARDGKLLINRYKVSVMQNEQVLAICYTTLCL